MVVPTNSKPKITPVYDVSNYGQDIFLPISTDRLTLQTFTWSSATLSKDTEDSTFPIDHEDHVVSDINTLSVMHEGNDTAFDRIYSWHPDMDAVVYKTRVNVAAACNISLYTTGTYSITSLRFIATERNPTNQICNLLFTAPTNALTAAGTLVHIFDRDFMDKFEVHQGRRIDFQFQLTVSTGTGTEQMGICPLFYSQLANTLKVQSESGIHLHIHATVTHADPVFRDNIGRISEVG